MIAAEAVTVTGLTHRYGDRLALDGLSLAVRRGEIFAFLGPNGGGKTTLFRLLSTLLPVQSGDVSILGTDLRLSPVEVRRRIGVVFQSPSLDKKLSVAENLRHQGHLYGWRGAQLRSRVDDMLGRLGVADRRHELCETLSGGLRRRVELAKGMLHAPELLLLDEPSTGLDPAARADMWSYLRSVRARDGVTIILTTHLLEEADKADRIAILSAGKLVALDTPDALRASVGGDSITIRTPDPAAFASSLQQRFSLGVQVLDGTVRVEHAEVALIGKLLDAFPSEIEEITLSKPSLEDVFITRTGHRLAGG
jgi:ABC-2 type transport system ATP-binding protein